MKIQEYENILRTIIISILGTDDDAPLKITSDRIDKWKEKREVERNKFNGKLSENRLIYFSDFYDLENIISKNWELFKDIFIEKKKFHVYFNTMETFRNTYAHGRTLFNYQESLIDGILGETKTLLTKFHNKNMNKDDYFIKFLRISDNLGNFSDGNSNMITEATLKVGDQLELKLEAFDPKGRKIKYSWKIPMKGKQESNFTGNFKIIVSKEMIASRSVFLLSAETEESDYANSIQITAHYCILP